MYFDRLELSPPPNCTCNSLAKSLFIKKSIIFPRFCQLPNDFYASIFILIQIDFDKKIYFFYKLVRFRYHLHYVYYSTKNLIFILIHKLTPMYKIHP